MLIEQNGPFRKKIMEINGQDYKLYENVHGGKVSIGAGQSGHIRIPCPYQKAFFTSIALITEAKLAKLDFHFETDDGQGGYASVYQHGHGVYIGSGTSMKDSYYEAEVNNGIYMTAYITNEDSTDREFAINVTLHRAVPQ